jgi:hypothetical protein
MGDSPASSSVGKRFKAHFGPLDLQQDSVLLLPDQVAVFNAHECWLSYKYRKQWGFKGLAGWGPPSKIEAATEMATQLIRDNANNKVEQLGNESDGDDWTMHGESIGSSTPSGCPPGPLFRCQFGCSPPHIPLSVHAPPNNNKLN